MREPHPEEALKSPMDLYAASFRLSFGLRLKTEIEEVYTVSTFSQGDKLNFVDDLTRAKEAIVSTDAHILAFSVLSNDIAE